MEPQNCWEFWNCQKEVRAKCPAYITDSGRDCFDLAENFCPRLKKEFKNCWECPWFKKLQLNPDFDKMKK